MILTGDCVGLMATLEAESVDAVVTDPPYGLEFMGKEWDSLGAVNRARGDDESGMPFGPGTGRGTSPTQDRPRFDLSHINQRGMQDWHHRWATEAFRLLKPGGYLLAFGGTRTYHRLASAIEDAGFEIRDCLVWAYASGFPKSLNLNGDWQGWGTALKPAWEPIVMARKPLVGTVAQNVTRYGTGALNIDATRIEGVPRTTHTDGNHRTIPTDGWGMQPYGAKEGSSGRWPANLILTDPLFDGGVPGVVGGGEQTSGRPERTGKRGGTAWHGQPGLGSPDKEGYWPADAGGGYSRFFQIPADIPITTSAPLSETEKSGTTVPAANETYARFFLIPKAARSDREPVLRGQVAEGNWTDGRDKTIDNLRMNAKRENAHPTVKPVELMRHLVRLVTPPAGTVLDCFLGSGTTAIACELEGFAWIGIEREPEYVAIAEARLNGTQRGIGL